MVKTTGKGWRKRSSCPGGMGFGRHHTMCDGMYGEDTLLGMENSTSVVSDDIIKKEDGRNTHTAL